MIIWGAGSVLFRERWGPGGRDESGRTDPGLVTASLIGEKWPECARAALVSAVDQGGRGTVSPFCSTRAAILLHLAGLLSG